MKRLTILTLFVAQLLMPLLAQKVVYTNEQLTITKLEEQMWVIETADNTTMYIIEGADKAMLIDTGTDCNNLDEVVRQVTTKPLYVVITHIHVDHAGNISDFEDIFFHPADTLLMSRLKKPYTGTMHYVEDGSVFDLGGKQIEVKHMPGHTPGSIVLIDYQSGNCYSGDAFGSGQVWCQLWPFSSMQTYEQSCRKMLELMDKGISKVYCGHYPHINRAFDRNYIEDMAQLAAMISAGTQPEPQPHPFAIPVIGAKKPMMTTYQSATIAYDPEHVVKGSEGEEPPL